MKRPQTYQLSTLAFATLVILAVSAGMSHAYAAATVGDTMKAAGSQTSSAVILMNYLAYAMGFSCLVAGAAKLKAFADNPERTPLSQPLWLMMGGTLAASAPFLAEKLQNTFNLSTRSGLVKQAAALPASAGGASMSLDQMLINFVGNIKGPMMLLVAALGFALGFYFLVTAFLRMAKGAAQDGPKGSLGSGTLGRVVFGSILISLGSAADIFTASIFGGSTVTFSGMNINGLYSASVVKINQSFSAILIFIQIIGFIAFVRGFLMLRALSDGNNSVSTAAAFTHLVGGTVALNISPALNVLQTTFCGAAGCGVMGFG